MAEAAQVATFGKDRERDDRTDAGDRAQALVVGVTLELGVDGRFELSPQFGETDVLLDDKLEHLHGQRVRGDGDSHTLLGHVVIACHEALPRRVMPPVAVKRLTKVFLE